MRNKWWWIWLYGLFSLPLLAQMDKGVLMLNIAVTDMLAANETHQYQFPDALEGTVTIQIDYDGGTFYAYLEDANHDVIVPLAADFSDHTLIQVYLLQHTFSYTLSIEGSGSYTVRLTRGNALQIEMGNIAPGDDLRGRLEQLSSLLYTLTSENSDVITVEVINNRQSMDIALFSEDGTTMPPAAQRLTGDRLLYVYELGDSQPYLLRLYGIGDYRLRLYADDLLREFMGKIAPGEPVSGTATGEHSLVYQLSGISSGIISVTLAGVAEGIVIRDADGQRLDELKHFRSAGLYTAVFELSENPPYDIGLYLQGSYTLTIVEGDASLVSEQSIVANEVQYNHLAPGRTPIYSLKIPENTEILLTLVLYGGTIYDTAPLIRSADGIETPAHFLPLTVNRLRLSVVPKGKPPYLFIPGITGAHVVSLVTTGVLPEKAVRIRLTTDNTNLRSGAALDAPVLREGAVGTELLAVARNDNGDWLLALTGDGLMVWVFRQLVEPIEFAGDLEDLPFAPGFAPPEPTVTPTTTATVTPGISLTPVVMPILTETTPEMAEVPETTLTPTLIPAAVCTISSGGGVNIRTGPGVNYAASGALTAGQIRGVIGQASDSSEEIWWQLADSAWVRSDLVQEIGNCEAAPIIKVSE